MEDRLESVYSGLSDVNRNGWPKFGGRGSSLFTPFKSLRDTGHTNPAFDDDTAAGARRPNANDDVNDDHTDDSISSHSEHDYENTTVKRIQSTEPFERLKKPESDVQRLVTTDKDDFPVRDSDLTEEQPPPYTQQPDTPKPPQLWNRFQTSTKEKVTGQDLTFWNRMFIGTKIVFCFVLFLITISTAVVSKVCFVIMTSNIVPPDMTFTTSLKTFGDVLKYPVKGVNVLWIWGLTVTMAAPYVFTIGRCLWRLVFQVSKRKGTSLSIFIKVLFIETLNSVGLNVLVYIVVPSLDPLSGVLVTLTVAVVPGLLKSFYPATKRGVKQYTFTCIGTCIGVIGAFGQVTAIGLWGYKVYLSFNDSSESIPLLVCMILAPIFISATWWENYIYQGKRDSTGLPSLVRDVRRRRTKLSLYVNIWKLILSIILPIAIFGIYCDEGKECIDVLYFRADSANAANGGAAVEHVKNFGAHCNSYLPLVVAGIGILCSGLCFKTAKVGCKIMTQIADFSLPLTLSTPAVVGIVIGMYSGFLTAEGDGCSLPFPVWNERADVRSFLTALGDDWTWLSAGLTGFLSLLLITNHIWVPGKERLQRTDKLFVQALYCGILPDHSLILNRRRIEEGIKISDTQHRRSRRSELPLPEDVEHDPSDNRSAYKTDDTPMIYMCATMWHENKNEMTQLLKSIFRMDEDQCTRKNAQFLLNRRDPDYYEFEAHIFFDDAFESHRDNEYDYTVNSFVKELIKTVQFSASAITGINYKIAPPQMVPAPYGGRLVWNLPGGNQLIAHLKDKAVIRHRKRWSQVMYMYFFLGHRLLTSGVGRKRLAKRAENTYLLALDGDVDFQPGAVQLLVDRMKKNTSVGAACGRIHPVGAGAMIWYQKFEYAVSHWLQKAAEDKLGCVLCSPGCFSLFRGSALMDDNVMQRYTTPPTEARHYVQYDQGEDRWLCTLLLQQGHRVEYCAASDALTYAPEGFYEFFNQRRRWTPSTLANILDLLTDWRNVTMRNPDISFIYILYQGLLLVSSVVTPGTIFMLILGAINMAYPQIDLWVALLINVIPIGVFIWLCFVANPRAQLLYAAIMSGGYSLVMMIVIVGLLRQAADHGMCSVTTGFLVFIIGVFVVSALLHPQEFWCILHGFLYFLAIPAMSMILILYSLGNLHVVSWGTREYATTEEEKKDPLSKWMSRISACCPRAINHDNDDKRLHTILDRLDGIEQSLRDISSFGSEVASRGSRRTVSPRPIGLTELNEAAAERFSTVQQMLDGVVTERENPMYQEPYQKPRDRMKNPYWIDEDVDLKNCKRGAELPAEEVNFWNELMHEYLTPIEGNAAKQKDIKGKLVELRNKVCLIVILLNSLFIIVVFSLQQVVLSGGNMSFDLPCATHNDETKQVHGQSIEPISVAFTLVFGVLLLIQFLCMLMHRFATLLHICASTQIFKEKRAVFRGHVEEGDQSEEREQKVTWEEGMELVRNMQRDNELDNISLTSQSTVVSEDDLDIDEDLAAVAERQSHAKNRWRRLARRRRELKGGNTLGANFRRNFGNLQSFMMGQNTDVGPDNEQEDTDKELQRAKFEGGLTRKARQTLVAMSKDTTLSRAISNRRLRERDVAGERFRAAFQRVRQDNMASGVSTGDAPRSGADIIRQAARTMQQQQHVHDAIDRLNSPSNQPSPATSRHELEPINTGSISRRNRSTSALMHNQPAIITDNAPNVTPRDAGTPRDHRDTPRETDNQSEYRMQIPRVEVDQWPSDDEFDKTTGSGLRNSDVLF